MKAIPTTYANTTFRSRLEASVAAHLNKIKIPWLYEPEGFELSDGTWYLPDFYLPTARAWMEVKGPHQERIDKVELFAADLWKESGAQDTYDKRAPMALLVNAPTPDIDYLGAPFGDMHLGMISVHRSASVGFAKCDQCSAVTVIAFFQPKCRNCGMGQTGEGETFNGWDSWMDYCMTPFSYLRAETKRG